MNLEPRCYDVFHDRIRQRQIWDVIARWPAQYISDDHERLDRVLLGHIYFSFAGFGHVAGCKGKLWCITVVIGKYLICRRSLRFNFSPQCECYLIQERTGPETFSNTLQRKHSVRSLPHPRFFLMLTDVGIGYCL